MSKAVLSVEFFYTSPFQLTKHLNLLTISNVNIFSVDHNNVLGMAVSSKGIKNTLGLSSVCSKKRIPRYFIVLLYINCVFIFYSASFHKRNCWQVLPSLLVQFEAWRRDSITYLTIRESLSAGKIGRIKGMPRYYFLRNFFVFMWANIIYVKIF